MRCAVLLFVGACAGSQISDQHAPNMGKLLPATLEADRPIKGEARAVHVRVWVDAGVRATKHWKEDIGDQLDYASQLLSPLVGARLQVDAIKDWDRTGDLAEAMRQLTAADKGDDITWVIGYTSALDSASQAMVQLGEAAPLGKHVVVRWWAENAENEKLIAKLPDLKIAQRTEIIGAHRRHKQTVVLLHMLAATLGAIAETDPAWIQHPTYSPKQSTFSDRNRELIKLALEDRLDGGSDQTMAKKLLEAIEKAPWGGWIPTDHDTVVAALHNVLESAKAGKTAADVPAAALEQFNRIRELARQGQGGEAMIELDNLLAAYPGNPAMHQLKCEIMIAARPDKPAPTLVKGTPPKAPAKNPPKDPAKPIGIADPATRAACAHASELAPGDPTPHIVVAEALVRAGDVVGARAELEKAETKVGNVQTNQADAWRRVIGIYLGMGSLTWTEEALDKAKLDKEPAAAQVAQTRARYGVRRGSKLVKPEDEAVLVKSIRDALDLIYASKFGDAATAIAKAERRWPGAPGLLAARCDLAFRQKELDAARAACQRALAADPDESWALYLSGVIAFRDTSPAGTRLGIEKLRAAIAKDPDLGQAWRALGKALAERAKDQAAFDALAKDYQAKFGQALPP
jgi:tetratricopeptide (TPR) repeat protein